MRGNFLYKKIGEQIVQERKKRKISQDKLALIADIDRTYLSRIEKGVGNPSIKVLHKISKNLGIKIVRLLRDL
jgi:transcriptional regulator with XRE-family HTH domain